MEDVDRAFGGDSRLTMSGVLNALDGVAAQEGRLVFMTTNHVERLDAALIRPGRCDVKVEIGLISKQQGYELFKKFFPQSPHDLASRFRDSLPSGRLSVSHVQSHLFLHRNNALDAIQSLPQFLAAVEAFDQSIITARERNEKAAQIRGPPLRFSPACMRVGVVPESC